MNTFGSGDETPLFHDIHSISQGVVLKLLIGSSGVITPVEK
jgi:hypothetical protein